MNKQDAIKGIEEEKIMGLLTYEDEAYNRGLEDALTYVNAIDEPEKPVVSQFVADWYEDNKGDIENSIFDYCFNWDNQDTSSFGKWFSENDNKPIQTLVNMHQFGYEVKKEKLYTVKFSNEDFGKIYIGIIRSANKLGYSTLPRNDKYSKCHFTESELKELKFWENPAFEIDEVEE